MDEKKYLRLFFDSFALVDNEPRPAFGIKEILGGNLDVEILGNSLKTQLYRD